MEETSESQSLVPVFTSAKWKKKPRWLGSFRQRKRSAVSARVVGLGVRNPAAFFPNAESREAKAGGGNAGDFAGVISSDVAAVLHEAGLGARLFPKKAESSLLQLLQEKVVFRRKRVRDARRPWCRRGRLLRSGFKRKCGGSAYQHP